MTFRTIVAMDWGAPIEKRSAYVADVELRTVRRLEGGPWTLAAALEAAAGLPGPVLLAIDAVLGLPQLYFDAARRDVAAWREAGGFLDWLRLAAATPGAFDPVARASDWAPAHPFFRVPKGKGSLDAYWTTAGGVLLRRVEIATGGKPMFVVSGIPGTVGSGTRALFMSLAPLLDGAGRAFGVWPFDGSLVDLAARFHCVVGEMYPRISYGVGVAVEIPTTVLPIAKTKRPARVAYLASLTVAPWVGALRVDLGELTAPTDDEDDFDAFVSAAAFLRSTLEERPLEEADLDRNVEGSMLGLNLIA